MLPKGLQNAPQSVTCYGLLDANPKMRKRVWTAPARADRGSGNPENREKTTKTRHANKRPHTPSILMEKCRKGSQKGVGIRVQNGPFFKDFDLGGPGVPKEATKLPLGTQSAKKEAKRWPQGAQRSQKGAQMEPKGAQRSQRGVEMEPQSG